jgi:hypothetical protein
MRVLEGSDMTQTPTLIVGASLAALAACRSPQQQQPSPAATPDQSPVTAPATRPSAAPEASSAQAPTDAQSSGASDTASHSFNFDADRAGSAPAAFSFGRTGSGAVGRWVTRAESDAPSKPNVLAQMDADATDYRFPVAVANAPSLRDLRLSVKCKPVSGKVDQACGLVFRYRDENNYFLTRANALEGNVRLYFVKNGQRKQISSYSGGVGAGAWHDYVVEARGDHIQVFWDGKKVLDHNDSTFPDAGRIGVWTKADSVTYFDDLTVTPVSGGKP